jgi:hypothetical protein
VAKFREKPVVIEAFRLGYGIMPEWFLDALLAKSVITPGDLYHSMRDGPDYALINTLEGQMRADFGDWVIRDVKGEIYGDYAFDKPTPNR